MIFDKIVTTLFLISITLGCQLANAKDSDCKVSNKEELLALDLVTFDQDIHRGWRQFENKNCEKEVANLLSEYGKKHPHNRMKIIMHEAQQRAFAGQTKNAVYLLEEFHANVKKNDLAGQKLYIQATIAHLNRDKKQLLKVADEYFKLPNPGYKIVDAHGKPVKMPWPLNKAVVENLIRCFDKSYKTAYKNCIKK